MNDVIVIEHPILFSGEMIRATLARRKTHTRRVIQPQPCLWSKDNSIVEWTHNSSTFYVPIEAVSILAEHCPYGRPGDRLWVRETWGAVSRTEDPSPLEECAIEYRADLPAGCTDQPGGWPADDARGNDEAPHWKPSIFMPRWASRITLEIMNVRVERVQDITETDAGAEGVSPNWISDLAGWNPIEHGYLGVPTSDDGDSEEGYYRTARQAYSELWDHLNANRSYGWAVNPFVWVIAFKPIETRGSAVG
jgi:hypothetical protein